MKSFRVAGYNIDYFCWELVFEFGTPAEAVAEFHAMKADRQCQWVAAAKVVGLVFSSLGSIRSSVRGE
ncbi:MAG: hypothetical protein K8U57_00835 [Planctomycetes bacterium]|nr:hypothetical protein [Planctomycetota bacterium]